MQKLAVCPTTVCEILLQTWNTVLSKERWAQLTGLEIRRLPRVQGVTRCSDHQKAKKLEEDHEQEGDSHKDKATPYNPDEYKDNREHKTKI